MIRINQENCSGCGTCEMVCPHHVIDLNSKRAFLSYEVRCIECGACQLNCPNKAIIVTKGTGCLLVIIKEDILKIEPKIDTTELLIGG